MPVAAADPAVRELLAEYDSRSMAAPRRSGRLWFRSENGPKRLTAYAPRSSSDSDALFAPAVYCRPRRPAPAASNLFIRHVKRHSGGVHSAALTKLRTKLQDQAPESRARGRTLLTNSAPTWARTAKRKRETHYYNNLAASPIVKWMMEEANQRIPRKSPAAHQARTKLSARHGSVLHSVCTGVRG